MAELSPEASRLLGLARRGDDPTEFDRVRLEVNTVQRMTVALSVGGTALGAAKLATGATLMSTLFVKGVAVGALVVTTGVGAWKAGSLVRASRHPVVAATAGRRTNSAISSESPAIDTTRGVAEPIRAVPAEPESATVTWRAEPRIAQTHGQPAIGSADRGETRANARLSAATPASEVDLRKPVSQADPLQVEALALREAQQALNSGQASRALVLVEEQEQRFKGGALGQERAATRIFALCNLGRSEEARSQRASFVRRWPRSPLLSRVRNACGSESP